MYSSPYFTSKKHCFDYALKYDQVLRRWDGKQCFALCEDRNGRPYGVVILASRTNGIWSYIDITCSADPSFHDKRLANALANALQERGIVPTEGESRWIAASLAEQPRTLNVGDKVRFKPGGPVSGDGIVVRKQRGHYQLMVICGEAMYKARYSQVEKI